jgi:putative transposase
MTSKKRRRHTPDQIIRKLAEGNKLLASGQELDAVCRHLEAPSRRGIAGWPSTAA